MSEFGVSEEAKRLHDLGMEIYNVHLQWADKNFPTTNSGLHGEYPKYEVNRYNGVISAISRNYFDFTASVDEIYKKLSERIKLGDAELESINKAWKSQKHSVEVEYNKLIAVCKGTRSNSKLVEHLVSLGFEEPKMRELLDTPISTALSTNINTSLLMLGGNSND